MSQYRKRTSEIHDFILANVGQHPKDITALTADKFSISRPAALRHVEALIKNGLLTAYGKTRDRRYVLNPIAEVRLMWAVTPDLAEDRIWRENLRPLLDGVAANVLAICQYAFTEVMNNVIDHSEARNVIIELKYTPASVTITVLDDGIGIFHKIKTELGLDDERHAILELSKGKLTTDPDHHTGEGIFFTSRAVDLFSILSGSLCFAHNNPGNDWLLEADDSPEPKQGTLVSLSIHPRSDRQLQDVFDSFAAGDDYGFTRTIVPVALAKYGNENLVSRSQAKRLLARFERFEEVILDFKGVTTIGQAFADEVFRVYAEQHPQIHLIPLNTNQQVSRMISRAIQANLPWLRTTSTYPKPEA